MAKDIFWDAVESWILVSVNGTSDFLLFDIPFLLQANANLGLLTFFLKVKSLAAACTKLYQSPVSQSDTAIGSFVRNQKPHWKLYLKEILGRATPLLY
jgi:hypothetical protein